MQPERLVGGPKWYECECYNFLQEESSIGAKTQNSHWPAGLPTRSRTRLHFAPWASEISAA